MPLRSDWSGRPCPIARGIDALGDPWVLLILRELVAGVHRFDEIREHTEAADNILAKRLKYMVENGLAVRSPYRDGSGGRRRFEYLPTRAGADALPILHAYALWAQRYTPSADPARRLSIVCRNCDQVSERAETCSSCGSALTTDTTAWIRPTHADHPARPLSQVAE